MINIKDLIINEEKLLSKEDLIELSGGDMEPCWHCWCLGGQAGEWYVRASSAGDAELGGQQFCNHGVSCVPATSGACFPV